MFLYYLSNSFVDTNKVTSPVTASYRMNFYFNTHYTKLILFTKGYYLSKFKVYQAIGDGSYGRQDLKNWVLAHVLVRTVYTRALERTRKNVHANFEVLLNPKILESYFTDMFYYCFIETRFIVHFYFSGNTGGMCVHFSTVYLFDFYTKLIRLKLVNSFVIWKSRLIPHYETSNYL